MTISIEKNELLFNNNIVKKSKPNELISVLKEQNRTINLDEFIYLYIYDEQGLRYWVDKSVIREFQVFFEINDYKNVFPNKEFTGNLKIFNFEISKGLKKEQLSEFLMITQDTDDLRYGINSVILNEAPHCKIFFNSNNIIERVSF